MKISSHPRMHNITIGDEVYSYSYQLCARVSETFPAAVCVRVGVLAQHRYMELVSAPQLWSAEEIENLSICRYCGSRNDLQLEPGAGIPFRVCTACHHYHTANGSNGHRHYPDTHADP
jgi:hypothetical protein